MRAGEPLRRRLVTMAKMRGEGVGVQGPFRACGARRGGHHRLDVPQERATRQGAPSRPLPAAAAVQGSSSGGATRHAPARGWAAVWLLLALAGVGGALAHVAEVGARWARGEAEDALLDVGREWERALASYARAPGQPRRPRELQDLLKDPRQAGMRRHLRDIRFDPLTGQREWGVVRAPDGGIVGIHSLAAGRPIKQAEFPLTRRHFAGAPDYRGWVFTDNPRLLPLRAGSGAEASDGARSAPANIAAGASRR